MFNTFDTRMDHFSRGLEAIKGDRMGVLEWENTITEIRKQWIG